MQRRDSGQFRNTRKKATDVPTRTVSAALSPNVRSPKSDCSGKHALCIDDKTTSGEQASEESTLKVRANAKVASRFPPPANRISCALCPRKKELVALQMQQSLAASVRAAATSSTQSTAAPAIKSRMGFRNSLCHSHEICSLRSAVLPTLCEMFLDIFASQCLNTPGLIPRYTCWRLRKSEHSGPLSAERRRHQLRTIDCQRLPSPHHRQEDSQVIGSSVLFRCVLFSSCRGCECVPACLHLTAHRIDVHPSRAHANAGLHHTDLFAERALCDGAVIRSKGPDNRVSRAVVVPDALAPKMVSQVVVDQKHWGWRRDKYSCQFPCV